MPPGYIGRRGVDSRQRPEASAKTQQQAKKESGARARAAASCKRQVRIWRGVAPMLARIPNWCRRACMVISNELRISRTSATATTPSTAKKKGSNSDGVGSFGFSHKVS